MDKFNRHLWLSICHVIFATSPGALRAKTRKNCAGDVRYGKPFGPEKHVSKGAPLGLQTIPRASHIYLKKSQKKKSQNNTFRLHRKREPLEARMNLQVAQSKLHEADKSTARPHGQTKETPEKQTHTRPKKQAQTPNGVRFGQM